MITWWVSLQCTIARCEPQNDSRTRLFTMVIQRVKKRKKKKRYQPLHTDPPCDHISRNIKVNKNCRHISHFAVMGSQMTVPIFSGEILTNFLGKNHFSSSKIYQLEHFLEISQNFMRKSLKPVTKIIEMVLIHNRGLKTIQ